MLYLSAQPDDYYFLWQLELQLFNFHKNKIRPEDIHVLIGYNPAKEVSLEFREFLATNKWASFFTYPDTRVQKNYPPSIRPHIIKQHLKAFPHLLETAIFYHDSDILFRELPDFNQLLKDDDWFVSDTRHYLDSKYILRTTNERLFNEMCGSVGIPISTVTGHDPDAGGAQYLLKNSTIEFWEKVELDSEKIFSLLSEFNDREGEKEFIRTGTRISQCSAIDAWCADMWAIFWNALLFGYRVRIHSELDFCWPYEEIRHWRKRKILHYAGIKKSGNSRYFCKMNYMYFPPYYEKLDNLDANSCSYPVKTAINELTRFKKQFRQVLQDVTFIILARIDSPGRLENLNLITAFLDKYFDTNIMVLEPDDVPKIPQSSLPESCQYLFIKDNNPLLPQAKYYNFLASQSKTSIIATYNTDVVIPVDQIIKSVKKIRDQEADYVSPYTGECLHVDPLFKNIFGKLLDPAVLQHNQGKFPVMDKSSWNGPTFLNKQSFINSGGDNERMRTSGCSVQRIEGILFHLHHSRKLTGSSA